MLSQMLVGEVIRRCCLFLTHDPLSRNLQEVPGISLEASSSIDLEPVFVEPTASLAMEEAGFSQALSLRGYECANSLAWLRPLRKEHHGLLQAQRRGDSMM